MPLGAPITQAITNGLGLAAEAIAARNQKHTTVTIIAKTSSTSSTESTEIAPLSYSEINGKSEYNEDEKTLESPERRREGLGTRRSGI
jgi:hypothetical protein